MRLQFSVDAPDLGLPDPMTPDQINHLVAHMEQRLRRAGYGVTLGSDDADVAPGEDEYETLTPEEQAAGGCDGKYLEPRLVFDNPVDGGALDPERSGKVWCGVSIRARASPYTTSGVVRGWPGGTSWSARAAGW